MDTVKAAAERISELSKEKNITMYKLSMLSGVPHTTLTSILNGTSKNPGILTIKKLCDALDLSLSEFFDSDLFI